MNNPIDSNSLNQVLDAYLSVSIKPNEKTLEKWILLFPEYENELIDFTSAWNDIENSPPALQTSSDDNSFIEIGNKIAREAFYAETVEEYITSRSAIQSILREGKGLGFSTRQLSDQLNISIALIRKIDLRYILFDTIPVFFMENLSETIKRSIREIAYYLSRPSRISENARFKSLHTPKITEQRNFFDEVRTDPQLKEEQREYWLSYEAIE